MRVDAKIQARQWILTAIQNHSCIPNKETEREIGKFIGRLQRDIRQLERSREMFLLVNSPDPEARAKALRLVNEDLPPRRKGRRQEVRKRSKELSRLIKEQERDANERKVRFEHAVSK